MKTILNLISANVEWREVKQYYQFPPCETSPYGEFFRRDFGQHQVIFFQGGWGKISAAASTQLAISQFLPDYVINMGTCGGFQGRINRGEILLAQRTLVYDIVEQMGDAAAAIQFYAVDHDLSGLKEPYPLPVRKTILVSADRDIVPEEIPALVANYDALAADWESGAIAWVCQRNQVPCFILRGVSDLVGKFGGEAYGGLNVFETGTVLVMQTLLDSLPGWVETITF